MANYLKGLGDPLNRINEIIPKFDAQIYRYLTQNNPGVCWTDSAARFAITNRDRGVQIGAGMIYAHGYYAMSDAPTMIDFILPSAGNQFARIFAEINLSVMPHRFTIRASAQSTSSVINLTQHNLTTSPSGIFQVPLYLVTINANGTITSTDQRVQLGKVAQVTNADQAAHATNATNLTGTGSIATGVTAVTQTAGNNTTRIATTAFVRAALSVFETFTHLASGASVGTGHNRAGGDGEWGRCNFPNGVTMIWYTSSDQHVTFPYSGFPNKCWFVGYAGHRGTGTSDNITSRVVGITWTSVTRTGFSWSHQSSASSVNNRRYWAIGW
jgi:hypothetical protein